MDAPELMPITVAATEAFAETDGPIMLRAWQGLDAAGKPVTALVASVRAKDDVEMSPVPFLSQHGSRAAQMAHVLDRLPPPDFSSMIAVAELLTGFPPTAARVDNARLLLGAIRQRGNFW